MLDKNYLETLKFFIRVIFSVFESVHVILFLWFHGQSQCVGNINDMVKTVDPLVSLEM